MSRKVKMAFYMNCVSAHQLPLAKGVAELVGAENFAYFDLGERVDRFHSASKQYPWIVADKTDLDGTDIILTGLRDLDLFERRAKKGLKTFYTSERWYKPIHGLPGLLRMLVPRYRRMVKRFVKWANEDCGARVFYIGPWAKKDFLRMGVKEERLVSWGYFVEPAAQGVRSPAFAEATAGKQELGVGERNSKGPLKVLWVGRMIGLKRVDTIIRAVRAFGKGDIELTLVGDGSEKAKLEAISKGLPVKFMPSMSNDKVRELMRRNDVYVFASNGYDGWGAVVSEALEEGMKVLGTCESGASAAMLSSEDQFHVGDWRSLRALLARSINEKKSGTLNGQGIGEWSVQRAAERLMELSAK